MHHHPLEGQLYVQYHETSPPLPRLFENLWGTKTSTCLGLAKYCSLGGMAGIKGADPVQRISEFATFAIVITLCTALKSPRHNEILYLFHCDVDFGHIRGLYSGPRSISYCLNWL